MTSFRKKTVPISQNRMERCRERDRLLLGRVAEVRPAAPRAGQREAVRRGQPCSGGLFQVADPGTVWVVQDKDCPHLGSSPFSNPSRSWIGNGAGEARIEERGGGKYRPRLGERQRKQEVRFPEGDCPLLDSGGSSTGALRREKKTVPFPQEKASRKNTVPVSEVLKLLNRGAGLDWAASICGEAVRRGQSFSGGGSGDSGGCRTKTVPISDHLHSRIRPDPGSGMEQAKPGTRREAEENTVPVPVSGKGSKKFASRKETVPCSTRADTRPGRFEEKRRLSPSRRRKHLGKTLSPSRRC